MLVYIVLTFVFQTCVEIRRLLYVMVCRNAPYTVPTEDTTGRREDVYQCSSLYYYKFLAAKEGKPTA